MFYTSTPQLRSRVIQCVLAVLPVIHMTGAFAQAVEFPAVREELLRMQERDQANRENSKLNNPDLDVEHTARLKVLIEEIGYPTISKVGRDGSNAAWLVVQHADHDQNFQLRVLDLLKPLAKTGEVNPRNYAYLYDRTHRPQRFGTQGRCVGGVWETSELESPGEVDDLRKEFGLEPLGEYTQIASNMACQE